MLYKIGFIILNIIFILPSLIYLIQNKTIMGFDTYFNFFYCTDIDKILSTIIYLIIFIAIIVIYLLIIKNKKILKNIRETLKYVTIVSIIFLIMLPWTSSDIFYYMGVGELDGIYHLNPYYVTIKDYYEQNKENINDEILEKGSYNCWADTTVVYGPIAQLIFKVCALISMKNIDLCLIIFKLLNLIIHIGNCYLIYKISRKNKLAIIYGLNPFILLEFIGNVHNDIILVFFVLLSLYFIIKKKNIFISLLFLALATGIKYFTILLLPVVILYYFKEEKKLEKRILKSIQYGVLFLIIFALEYVAYFKDLKVLLGLVSQNTRFCKSIYSVMLWQTSHLTTFKVRFLAIIIFISYYLKFCIDIITEKEIKLYKVMRKYNISLILFLLILTNFQQWYISWLFATIIWQKPNTIRNIIGISAITEIANSIYMFKEELYIYDIYFIGIIICLFVIWQVITNNKKRKSKASLNYRKIGE